MHSEFIAQLSQKIGFNQPPSTVRSVGGGCIHQAQYWEYPHGERVFVKRNSLENAAMLSTEHLALKRIRKTQSVRCPEPLHYEEHPINGAFLILEFLDLERLDADAGAKLGNKLAELHRNLGKQYGFEVDNFIGATPQLNDTNEQWAVFYWEQRLNPQMEWAQQKGYSLPSPASLESAIMALLQNHNPPPSLLHGDLWGGNAASLSDGTPVIFDPASYYGDAETDLAFTEVFGGFPKTFYESYWETSQLDAEAYQHRKIAYNLYHYLNHLNLFGASYLGTCQNLASQLIEKHAH